MNNVIDDALQAISQWQQAKDEKNAELWKAIRSCNGLLDLPTELPTDAHIVVSKDVAEKAEEKGVSLSGLVSVSSYLPPGSIILASVNSLLPCLKAGRVL